MKKGLRNLLLGWKYPLVVLAVEASHYPGRVPSLLLRTFELMTLPPSGVAFHHREGVLLAQQ